MGPAHEAPRRSSAVVASVGIVVAIGLAGLGGVLVSANGQPVAESQLVVSLPFVSFAGVGALIAWKRPDNAIGWLLLLGGLSMLAYGAGEEYARYGLVTAPGALPGAAAVAALRAPLWTPGAVITLVLVPVLFPTGRPPGSRWRVVPWAAGAVGLAMVTVQWLAAWPVRGVALLDPDQAWMQQSGWGRLTERLFPFLLVLGLSAVVSLYVRYRQASQRERLQIKWVLYSVGLFLASLLFDVVASVELGAWGFWTVVLIPAGLGVAVLRHRLYDIDRLISRTVGYAVVVAILGGVYAASVLAFGTLARALTGERGDLVVALSTLVVAAVVRPLAVRVRAVVDRRFDRQRYDAAETAAELGRALRDQLDLEAVERALTTAVAVTVAPGAAWLWLPRPASD